MQNLPHVEGPPCSDVIFNDGCPEEARHFRVTVLPLLPVSSLLIWFFLSLWNIYIYIAVPFQEIGFFIL